MRDSCFFEGVRRRAAVWFSLFSTLRNPDAGLAVLYELNQVGSTSCLGDL